MILQGEKNCRSFLGVKVLGEAVLYIPSIERTVTSKKGKGN